MKKIALDIVILILLFTVSTCLISCKKTGSSKNNIEKTIKNDKNQSYEEERIIFDYKKISIDYKEFLNDDINQWYDSSGNYCFPENVKNYKSWKNNYNNTNERIAACQVPNELLENMSTEEMYELLKKCPFNAFFDGIYGTDMDGLIVMKYALNLCFELIKRKDCFEVIKADYAILEIPDEHNFNVEKYMKNIKINERKKYNKYIQKALNNKKIRKKIESDRTVSFEISFFHGLYEYCKFNNIITSEQVDEAERLINEKKEKEDKWFNS